MAQVPSVPSITIDAPADGTETSARSVPLAGTAPVVPKSGYIEASIKVNRRGIAVDVRRDGSYRSEIVLEVGRNEITAEARIWDSWEDIDKPPTTVVSSVPIVVTRTPVPGDGTGVLDPATSLFVADDNRQVYWLCGESDDCVDRLRCFAVTSRRVDCPGASRWVGERSWRCGVVVTVRVRRERIYFGSYRCRGRVKGNFKRFVRRGIWRKGRRFTVDVKESPWLRSEIDDRNRYGVPRFDIDRNLFIP